MVTPLKYKCYIAIFVTAIAYTGWHILSFTTVREIGRLSVFSEGSIALMLLVSICILQTVRESRSFYMLLMPGFTFLFIAFWTDTLDEIFIQPKYLTSLFEDIPLLIGFTLVIAGIYKWTIFYVNQKEELLKLARTDPLTGLLNRAAFIEKADLEIERSRRYDQGLALMVIDIDNFKAINDTHGHLCGDEILRNFSKKIGTIMRSTDIITRWGGDEFIVLLPESRKDHCVPVANKLRLEIAKFPLLEGNDKVTITLSIGVTMLSQNNGNLEALISSADKALYSAKEDGKSVV